MKITARGKCISSQYCSINYCHKNVVHVRDFNDKVAEMESLRMQLQRVEERSEERSAEVERLRSEAVELLSDMAACRRKEAELLEFTQKLTDKNVTLQVPMLIPLCPCPVFSDKSHVCG